MKFNLMAAAATVLFCSWSAPAAGQISPPETQALSECLVQSTTPDDHVVLARWIFAAMARHPSVIHLSQMRDADRVTINQQIGALFNRLLLDNCASESRAALVVGPEALEAAFGTLGETAMGTLMSQRDVQSGVAEMAAYVDQQGLAALVEPE